MSLERQDVRAKVDPDVKRALKIYCDLKGLTEAEFLESLIEPVVRQFIHDSIEAADELRRQGIVGKNRERPGIAATGDTQAHSGDSRGQGGGR